MHGKRRKHEKRHKSDLGDKRGDQPDSGECVKSGKIEEHKKGEVCEERKSVGSAGRLGCG